MNTSPAAYDDRGVLTAVNAESNFYNRILGWCLAGAGLFTAAMLLPISPPAPLVLICAISPLVLLLVTAFSRKLAESTKWNNFLVIFVSLALGVSINPVIANYLVAGKGGLVLMAGLGAVVTFGGMASWGAVSKRDMRGMAMPLLFILIGIIVVSLVNSFFLHLPVLELLISIAVFSLFALFTFIDIQFIKHASAGDALPASFYALSLLIDLFNMFSSLLDILDFFDS